MRFYLLMKAKKMDNLSFVLWMLGYPLINSISRYFMHITGYRPRVNVAGISALISIALYIFVGWKLFR